MIGKAEAMTQAERLYVFNEFPRLEWSEAAFNEYVTALMRCQSEQQCREVVTHFVETATKSPTVAVVLAQVRITNPIPTQQAKRCGKCVDGWIVGYYLSEGPGATPQPISKDEAESLLERIRNTKRTRSQVVTGARKCNCLPTPTPPVEPKQKGGKVMSFSDFT